jgi:hypothetical protein
MSLIISPNITPLFTSTTDGSVAASGGGTTNFLRADGTWASPASGSFLSASTTSTQDGYFTGINLLETGASPTFYTRIINGTDLTATTTLTLAGLGTANRTLTFPGGNASVTLAHIANLTQTFAGETTFSKGVNHGNEHFPTYKINLDFGADVAGTWRRIVVASLANINFSTVGFRIRVVDPNANHATTTSVNADFETYMVACIRTESTTTDTPDNCVVRGPSDRIRAVKTAVGSYEIQIQNQFVNTEYQIEIDCYANNGSHTITYENGSTVGSTGTAQYTATVGSSIFFTEKLTAKGSITADGGATFTAGQTVAFNNTAAAPFTVASTIQVTNLNASQLAGNSIGTSGATIPLCNGVNTFSGNTIFSGGTVTVGTSTGSGTYGLGTGATVNAATKTINIGTNGVSGSTTNINIGSATSDTTTDIYGILEVLAAQTGGAASNGLIKIHGKDFGTVPATITQGAFNLSTPWLVINSGTDANSFVSIQSANNAYTWTFGSGGVLSAPGNISTTGQLVSTVTTGTAPLSVVSNTVVPNLNASLLSGNAVGTSGNTIPLCSGANVFSNASISVGTSTASSVYGLGTGATINGATKAIDIGTSGVSGSTTTITIGSNVGTTTLNFLGSSATFDSPATNQFNMYLIGSRGITTNNIGAIHFQNDNGGTAVTAAILSCNGNGLINASVDFSIGSTQINNGSQANTAWLATGTASASTYLRGDGTWATVTGGSGLSHADTMSRISIGF